MLPLKWKPLLGRNSPQFTHMLHLSKRLAGRNSSKISRADLKPLLAIRQYLDAQGETDRDICIIPASAHGTNAASAVLAGLQVIVVKTADDGSIDSTHLDEVLEKYGERIAAIMITYPSTAGIYDT